mmetsp:Transcript_6089/g.14166  ORF Transcript_6089/g.14166 Transcript_6089/m.14166 type:complete len:281 (+) Transcript_6089:914-1756(+)
MRSLIFSRNSASSIFFRNSGSLIFFRNSALRSWICFRNSASLIFFRNSTSVPCCRFLIASLCCRFLIALLPGGFTVGSLGCVQMVATISAIRIHGWISAMKSSGNILNSFSRTGMTVTHFPPAPHFGVGIGRRELLLKMRLELQEEIVSCVPIETGGCSWTGATTPPWADWPPPAAKRSSASSISSSPSSSSSAFLPSLSTSSISPLSAPSLSSLSAPSFSPMSPPAALASLSNPSPSSMLLMLNAFNRRTAARKSSSSRAQSQDFPDPPSCFAISKTPK